MRWFAPILLVCSLVVLLLPASVAAKTSLSYPGLTFQKETTPTPLHPLKLIFGLFKQQGSLVIAHETPIPTRLAHIVPLQNISDDFLSPELQKDVLISIQKPSPTEIPPTSSPTPSPTVKPLKVVASSPTPSPTVTPTPTQQVSQVSSSPGIPANPTGGLNAEKLFNLVNNYHMSKGNASYQTDSRACELASARASEVGEEIANNHMHSGLRARNLAYWNSENIISYNSEEGAFNWWINDTIHREQIEADYKYSCLACVGNACAQEFTNNVAK